MLQRLEQHGADEDTKHWAALLGKDEDSYLLENIRVFRAMLEWRRERMSPPRCLRCGSVDLHLLRPSAKDELDSFEHPGCGGTFKTSSVWHVAQEVCKVLDIEGLPYSDNT